MSSLFSKFSTLIKASLGNLRKEKADTTYVSGADIERRLEEMAEAAKSAELPSHSTERVQKSAEEAAELAQKAKKYAEKKAGQSKAINRDVLKTADKMLDSAELEAIAIPTNASDAVKKSARQASELIEKARGLVDEKSAELEQIIEDNSSTTAPPHNPATSPPSDNPLDEIKNRLG